MAAIVKSSGALKLSITHGEEAQLMLIHHVCGAAMRKAAIVGTRVPVKRSSSLLSSRAACPIQKADLSPRGSSTGEPGPRSPGGRPWSLLLQSRSAHGTVFGPAY